MTLQIYDHPYGCIHFHRYASLFRTLRHPKKQKIGCLEWKFEVKNLKSWESMLENPTNEGGECVLMEGGEVS